MIPLLPCDDAVADARPRVEVGARGNHDALGYLVEWQRDDLRARFARRVVIFPDRDDDPIGQLHVQASVEVSMLLGREWASAVLVEQEHLVGAVVVVDDGVVLSVVCAAAVLHHAGADARLWREVDGLAVAPPANRGAPILIGDAREPVHAGGCCAHL